MPSLFDFEDHLEGYRLESFEFYNWGAFDNKIWTVHPRGHSSLLTGGNGSGKTTLVDALVTLLVPPGQRHYNQSSGAERKKERTELSYILGAVGSMRDEEQGSARVEYLRKRNIYSVLVGTFRNEALDKTLSLGQIRWFTPSGGMSRLYFTCTGKISIKSDIHPLDSGGKYRKRLESSFPIKFYDSFQQYALFFIKSFGFRSEKALSLFSQTVGVKVLGNLNEFIRTHMLEKPTSEDSFNSLYDNYQTLLGAHRQIEKSEKQIGLLKPIVDSAGDFRQCEGDILGKEALSRFLPSVFHGCKSETLNREELLLRDKKESLLQKSRNCQSEQKSREDRLFSIRQELEGNKTAIRLSVLENDMVHTRERLERTRGEYLNYDGFARLTGLRSVKKLEDFQENRCKAEELLSESREQSNLRQEELYRSKRDLELLSQELKDLNREILSLSKRKNNIPFSSIELRRNLCRELSIPEDDLPYAGELLRVRKEEGLWLGAAEKVLHSFALCLLVPEEHYKKVNSYVNSRNLKGRLIYYRIKTGKRSNTFRDWELSREKEGAVLPDKIEIKPDSPFRDWLEDTLEKRFRYSCVEQVEELVHYDAAVTPQGLVKSRNRHEKDDRPGRSGETKYVLGWDNRDKLKALISERDGLDKKLVLLETESRGIEKAREEGDQFILLLDRLLEIQDFDRIDWFLPEKNLNRMEREKTELLAGSEDLKKLEAARQELEAAISNLKKELADLQKLLGRMEQDEESIQQRREDLERERETLPEEENLPEAALAPYLPGSMELPWEDLLNLQNRVHERIEGEIRTLLERKNNLTAVLIRRMQEFISPGAGILEEYPGWTAETSDLQAHQDNIEAFEAFYNRLKKDDLPRFRKKFKEFLNERMLEDLIGFRESLDRAERNILKSIEELNRSLKKIEYNKNPSTYISLLGERTRDIAIKEFKQALKDSMGDAVKITLGDDAELENTFYKMQSLILRLKEEENYRRKVLDVRNWLEFSAEERYKEDDSQKQFYQDSHSLSGGEKAKLAYTILASAIAYQFGINTDGEKSFRFVIVDEAFSKVDPENSEYAMKLFRNLSLQLMVVTPLDKINLVEDYIQSVHYVENRDQISYLHNLTFQEYEDLKKQNRGSQ